MILLAVLLAFFGLLLVVIEFFIPGGILAIMGAIILLSSITVMAFSVGLAWLFAFVLCLGVLIGVVCQIALAKVKASKKSGSYFHAKDQEGFTTEIYSSNLQGKKGVVVTDLRPSGHIEVEGKRYQAISEEGYLAKETEVKIVRIEGPRTIVNKVKG